MERFAGRDLQTFEIDFVLFVERDVVLGEIFADDADEFDRREKARGHGGVAGGTAEQARVFRIRRFEWNPGLSNQQLIRSYLFRKNERGVYAMLRRLAMRR